LQEQVAVSARAPQPANGSHAPSPSPNGEKSKRLNPIKRKQMQERAQELEEEISGLEAAIATCENSLQSFVSAEETTRIARELEQNRADLQARTAEWEQIEQELTT
jgi:chromosome segregation ATPase